MSATRRHPAFPRVNVLIVGPDEAVDRVLESVVGSEADATTWCAGMPFEPPDPGTNGLLLLRGVDALPPADQQRLLEWLEEAVGRVQVVSTAAAPLLPLVDSGAFPQALYYRLNTIYMDLTDSRIPPGDW